MTLSKIKSAHARDMSVSEFSAVSHSNAANRIGIFKLDLFSLSHFKRHANEVYRRLRWICVGAVRFSKQRRIH